MQSETPNATDTKSKQLGTCWISSPLCSQMSGIVYRHADAHGIFVDLSFFGCAGCWQNDCRCIPQQRSPCIRVPALRGRRTSSTVRTGGILAPGVLPFIRVGGLSTRNSDGLLILQPSHDMEMPLQEGCGILFDTSRTQAFVHEPAGR